MDELLEGFRKISGDVHDILDLYYLLERDPTYGAIDSGWTLPGASKTYCPFITARLERTAFRMPAPVSQCYALHREILKRYLPSAWHIPVNETLYLPAMVHPQLIRWTKRFLEGKKLIVHKMHGRTHGPPPTMYHTAGLIRQYAQSCTEDRDGLLMHVFHNTALAEKLRTMPDAGNAAVFARGHLISMHAWYRQVREARARSQRVE